MFLGIEIGGTKLQLGVGDGESDVLACLERTTVDATLGAEGILKQVESIGKRIIEQHPIDAIGIGFGGPVDQASGVVFKSHQVDGWDSFHLTEWANQRFHLPTHVVNDCDAAALGEATLGAGKELPSIFYVTVGTGIGGGFVHQKQLAGADRPAIAEIGHLRPGPQASESTDTVESISSGTGIANLARKMKQHLSYFSETSSEQLTAKWIGEQANDGNPEAIEVLEESVETLGWAIAQVITTLAPHGVIVGGGVSLIGDEMFLDPLRRAIDRFVFPPLKGSFQVLAAGLAEEVVVHGAIQFAHGAFEQI